jgi:DNA polymerase-3 subunit gamma/tau
VANQFSEEELARFLQIMLRTFDELGYRQEQRFHLELGVLKLVHAQRILPLEQILSQVGAESQKAPEAQRTATARPAPLTASSSSTPGLSATPRQQSPVSPFEADRARKGRSYDPEMSAAPATAQAQTSATATAVAVEEPLTPQDPGAEARTTEDPGKIMGHVLTELEKAGHKMLASTLESGSVTLKGNEVVVSIAQSAAVIDLMMSAEPKRLANAAASAAMGRPAKVNVVSGVPAATNGATSVLRPRNGASARSRAAEDPIVQRMREKFGAEIRTVIDHREKN